MTDENVDDDARVIYLYFKNYVKPEDADEAFDKEVFDLIRTVKRRFPNTIEGNRLANKFFGSLILAFYDYEFLDKFIEKQESLKQ